MVQLLSCKKNLTEKEIYNSLISFENNKSPGNDGLTKEFYCTFWDDIKNTFMKLLEESNSLKISLHFTSIKLLEKLNKDKRYISNWRPISLLNFDLKIISKSLATRVKKVLSNLIDARQTAYAVLQIRLFQLARNCKAEFQAYKSCRKSSILCSYLAYF